MTQPEVLDDNAGEAGIPPTLDVRQGWVGNETASAFSIFMLIRALEAPSNASVMYHYHFHFQVNRTDGATALYHAMVHRTSNGHWTYLVQRWLPAGGTGMWGDANSTAGYADDSTGVIEVVVNKAFVASPSIDLQRGTWTIDRFYIHADSADAATGAVTFSDAAPAIGTMGSYAVSQGAPARANAPGLGAVAALVAVGAAAMVIVWLARRPRA